MVLLIIRLVVMGGIRYFDNTEINKALQTDIAEN